MTTFVMASLILIAAIGYMAWIWERDVVQAVIVTCAVIVLFAILGLVIVFSLGIGTTAA